MDDLPSCPHCRATLVPVRGHGHGIIECECAGCSAVVLVNASKQIAWKTVEQDVSGNLIDGD